MTEPTQTLLSIQLRYEEVILPFDQATALLSLLASSTRTKDGYDDRPPGYHVTILTPEHQLNQLADRLLGVDKSN
jgi:hypothetical protein